VRVTVLLLVVVVVPVFVRDTIEEIEAYGEELLVFDEVVVFVTKLLKTAVRDFNAVGVTNQVGFDVFVLVVVLVEVFDEVGLNVGTT
jgi:hypothetical protein